MLSLGRGGCYLPGRGHVALTQRGFGPPLRWLGDSGRSCSPRHMREAGGHSAGEGAGGLGGAARRAGSEPGGAAREPLTGGGRGAHSLEEPR